MSMKEAKDNQIASNVVNKLPQLKKNLLKKRCFTPQLVSMTCTAQIFGVESIISYIWLHATSDSHSGCNDVALSSFVAVWNLVSAMLQQKSSDQS